MREVDWRLRAISKRTDRELRFQASIHDKEIGPSVSSDSDVPLVELSEEQKSAIHRAKLESLSRLKSRHGRK